MIDFAFPTSRHVAQAAVKLTWRCLPIVMPLGLLILPGIMLAGLEPPFHLRWLQTLLHVDDANAEAFAAVQTAVNSLGRPVSSFITGAGDVLGSAIATVLLSGWLSGQPLGLLQAIGSLRGRGTEIGIAAIFMGAIQAAAQLLFTGAYGLALHRQGIPVDWIGPVIVPFLLLLQIFICCNFSVVGPLVAKGVDGAQSLGASHGLCRGKRWRIMGAWLWTVLFSAAPLAALSAIVILASPALPGLVPLICVAALMIAPVRFILPALLLFDVRVATVSQAAPSMQKAA